MQHVSLLQGRAHGAMQTIFQIEPALPTHDMGEQVAEIGRIIVEQIRQIQLALRGGEVVEADLAR